MRCKRMCGCLTEQFRTEIITDWEAGLVGLIVFALLLGVIPGVIAQGKGRNFVSWWLYGAAIFIVALPPCPHAEA